MILTAILSTLIADWWDWFVEFWDLNVDRWLSAGWLILGILTAIATIGMFLKIIKSHKEITP